MSVNCVKCGIDARNNIALHEKGELVCAKCYQQYRDDHDGDVPIHPLDLSKDVKREKND